MLHRRHGLQSARDPVGQPGFHGSALRAALALGLPPGNRRSASRRVSLTRPGGYYRASFISRRIPSSASPKLGEGLFVYLVVWVLAAYHRQPGLQATATAALLLSAGFLAKPPVAISCALLSVAFFLFHVRTITHPLGFGLLLFTPAILCAAGAVGFTLLTAGRLLAGASAIPAALPDQHIWRYLFLLPVATLSYRIVRRRFGEPDLAYLAMACAGSLLCQIHWPADGLSLDDLFFIAAGGAAALLVAPVSQAAQTPARANSSWPSRHRRAPSCGPLR